MPDRLDTHVEEDQLLAYQGADFDEACLADRSGTLGAQVWCWTRREADHAKASWLRLIVVVVDDKDSPDTVERVRDIMRPRPVADPRRPVPAQARFTGPASHRRNRY